RSRTTKQSGATAKRLKVLDRVEHGGTLEQDGCFPPHAPRVGGRGKFEGADAQYHRPRRRCQAAIPARPAASSSYCARPATPTAPTITPLTISGSPPPTRYILPGYIDITPK